MNDSVENISQGHNASKAGCALTSWGLIVLAAVLAFTCVAGGVTAYAWWVFLRSGYLIAAIAPPPTAQPTNPRAAPTTIARPATATQTPTQMVTPLLTPTTVVIIISSAIQSPVSQPAGSGTVELPTPTPSVAQTTGVTSTLIVPLRPATPTVTRTPVPRPRATHTLPATQRPQIQGHLAFPAYNTTRRGWDLYVAGVDGSNRTLIREQASDPAFSPDGTRLAFRSWHPSYLGLELLDLNSKQVTQLTRYAEDAWPSWSRDVSTLLLFASQRQSDRRWRLYGVMADGKTEWELSHRNQPIYAQTPAWLTNNQMVYAGCVENRCGIVLADGDGSHARPLTTTAGDMAPVASPDGQWVAFMAQVNKNWDLQLVNVSTGDVLPVAQSPSDEGSPAWSPDGRFIAFVSNRNGPCAVWAVAFAAEQTAKIEPTRLFDLTGLPAEGWPWLNERLSWGP